ncbi:hypothetical protein Pcinc_044154 [Petrolisthes cinctipes]|uniref:Uncharacterized protein n=1 Tax=Petrolisthes cinctipes TaxID=88211 RepID=A0AAE1BF49_PETCI|nr:hypothetical protein Pcinc_044154 [Petrolisthes cinctipes]
MEQVLTQSGSADKGGFRYAPSSEKLGPGAASHVPVVGKDVSSGYRQQPRNTGPHPPFKRVICYHCVEAGYIQPRSTKRKPAVTPKAVQYSEGTRGAGLVREHIFCCSRIALVEQPESNKSLDWCKTFLHQGTVVINGESYPVSVP